MCHLLPGLDRPCEGHCLAEPGSNVALRGQAKVNIGHRIGVSIACQVRTGEREGDAELQEHKDWLTQRQRQICGKAKRTEADVHTEAHTEGRTEAHTEGRTEAHTEGRTEAHTHTDSGKATAKESNTHEPRAQEEERTG